jgi:membrane protein
MKRIITELNHDEDIVKLSIWKRLFTLLFYYMRLGLHDLYKLFSNFTEPDKRKLMFENIHKFVILFYKKSAQEEVLKEAAALTYITILGFIPFLFFIVFLVPKLPFLAVSSKFQTHLYQNFLPVSTGDVGFLVSQLIAKRAPFNVFSFVVAIVTSYSLFKVIRDAFDRILVMEFQPPKDLLSQLLKFFGTIIFGFITILLLFSSSSLPIISSLLNIPLFKKQLLYILPFILQFLALVFMYMILPTIKVKRSSLYRAAFWTTLVWVILKGIFDYYIYNLTNIEAIYGVLKSLPIFLFWIYLNWVIILAGMVLVTVLEQKEKALDVEDKKHFVRLTLEMYTDKKMDKAVDTILEKNIASELIEKLTREKPE